MTDYRQETDEENMQNAECSGKAVDNANHAIHLTGWRLQMLSKEFVHFHYFAAKLTRRRRLLTLYVPCEHDLSSHRWNILDSHTNDMQGFSRSG